MTLRKGNRPWNKGKKLSDEHKEKLSESHKGQDPWNKGKKGVFSEENKKKHSQFMKEYYNSNKHPMLGRKFSKESKEKMSEAQKKRFSDPKERERMKKNQFPKGNIPHNKGKKYSKEIRRNMYRNTIGEMQEIAKNRGGECLSEEYNGSSNNLRWRCKEDHEWEATPHNIKKNQWCPTCSTRIGEKICRSYFEVFFEDKFPKRHPSWMKGSKGKNLELDGYCKKLNLAFEYQGEQHYLPNHYFNRGFSLEKIQQHDELKKQRCPENSVTLIQVPYHTNYEKLGKWIEAECKKEGFKPLVSSEKINYKKFDVFSSKKLEEMQEIARSKGGECLSEKYINNSTKLIWKCKQGHIWEAMPAHVKRRNWCPICSRERAKHSWHNQFGTASEFQEKELNELISIAVSKNGKCLSAKYIDAKTKLEFQCEYGHVWKTTPDNIKQGKWCRKCSYDYRASLRRGNIEEMKKIAERQGGKCLSEKYINVDTKLKWQCGKGHIWEAVPSSIKRGSWCMKCVKRPRKVSCSNR